MKISLVVVCHQSSRVLSRCVESFRREAAACGVEAEIVAVEHSEDADEIDQVRKVDVDRLLERSNRGYAAGLNAGADETTGEVLLLANPDVFFFPGSIGALLSGIDRGYDVVGPQFAWDDDGLILLPAAEDPAPRAELGRALRLRSPWLWSASLSRTLGEAWRLWTAQETVSVGGLRGALLAVSKEALSHFGPFDEGYFLYYEETEWLWRARSRGARLGLAADAKVQHRWGHATGQSDGAAEREETSRRRFVARNYGGLWRRILRAGGAGRRRSPISVERLDDFATVPNRAADLWLASPFPHLMPALGSLRAEAMPSSFLDFCRTWRWVVAAAVRENDRWRIDGAWTWGS
jgi:GT2 family glycosyltransferase